MNEHADLGDVEDPEAMFGREMIEANSEADAGNNMNLSEGEDEHIVECGTVAESSSPNYSDKNRKCQAGRCDSCKQRLAQQMNVAKPETRFL